MSFGGFFGGGSSSGSGSGSSSSTTSSSSSSSSSTGSLFPTGSGSSAPVGSSSNESSLIRQRLQTAVSTQSNIINAKYLISKVNENCFSHCVPYPGSSLSSKEQSCLSSCMEKYIEAWNVTSRTYVGRLQREGASLQGVIGGAGAGGGGGGSGGKELF